MVFALAMVTGNGDGNGGIKIPKVSANVMNIMALVVTCVWGMAFLADIAIPTYAPPPSIHFFPVAAVSALFGINLMGKS